MKFQFYSEVIIIKSNCLIEAVKAKILSPFDNKIYKNGSWLSPWPHYYWYHKPHDKYYSYCQKDTLSLLQQLWYEGEIVEYIRHKN